MGCQHSIAMCLPRRQCNGWFRGCRAPGGVSCWSPPFLSSPTWLHRESRTEVSFDRYPPSTLSALPGFRRGLVRLERRTGASDPSFSNGRKAMHPCCSAYVRKVRKQRPAEGGLTSKATGHPEPDLLLEISEARRDVRCTLQLCLYIQRPHCWAAMT